MLLLNVFAKTVEKSDKCEEKHGRRKPYEKEGYNSSLPCAVLTLIGCGNNAQSSDEHKCEDGFLLSKQIWKILQQMCWLLRCLSKSF